MNLSKSFVNSPYNADKNIMTDILLTLLVIMIAGAYYFGYRSIMVTLVCVVFAIISEIALKHFITHSNFGQNAVQNARLF